MPAAAVTPIRQNDYATTRTGETTVFIARRVGVSTAVT